MRTFFLLICTYTVCIYGFVPLSENASDPVGSSSDGDELMRIMHKTIMNIQSIKVTGDPDYDFASIVILHNEGGIELLKEVIKKGSDPDVISIAKKIKKNKEKEIRDLKKFVANYVPGSVNVFFIKAMKYYIDKTKKKINNGLYLSGDINKDFVYLMVVHHKHGEEIAKTEVRYGKDPAMQNFAKKMANNHRKELKQITIMLD